MLYRLLAYSILFEFGPIRTHLCLCKERPIKQTNKPTPKQTNKQTNKQINKQNQTKNKHTDDDIARSLVNHDEKYAVRRIKYAVYSSVQSLYCDVITTEIQTPK